MRDYERIDRRARRAIGAGAAIVLLGFAVGCALAFVPAALGLRLDPMDAPALDWIPVGGSLLVGLVGLVVIVYGLAQLARSRPRREETV